MDTIGHLYETQPFWAWLALGALLLAAEMATGSGWLLWPAASAGVTAVVAMIFPIGSPAAVSLFAVLTLVSTYAARRWLVRAPAENPDINDSHQRLVGQTGRAVDDFDDGQGRAFVGGAEWPADLDGSGRVKAGEQVTVTAVKGSRLIVKPA